jgi:hypothetical protein
MNRPHKKDLPKRWDSTLADHAGKGIEKAAESLQKEPKESDGKGAQPQGTQK